MSFPNLYDRWLFFYSSICEVKVSKLISVHIDALALVEELAYPHHWTSITLIAVVFPHRSPKKSVSPLESPPPYGIGTGSAQSAQATAAGTAAKAGKL